MPTHVLVIEDNSANLELMTYLLRAFGYEVSTAEDGGEGLELMRGQTPDIVICDVHLPRVSGYDVARLMKQDPSTRHIPLIAVTALAMVGDRDRVLSAGFDGYIAKPITPELFTKQVERFLRAEKRSQVDVRALSAPAAALNNPVTPAGATILVIDDVAVNLNLMKTILEHFGYQMIAARCVREAMVACERADPDLIITDVHLTDGTGYDILRHVRSSQRLNTKPVVVLSSSADPKEREFAFQLGALAVLARPIEPELLIAEIAGALNSAQAKEYGTYPHR